MFSAERSADVRDLLLRRAETDERIIGAALTGSEAQGTADRWSDVDLFFGVAPDASVETVLGDWSDFAYRELGALHHFDLHSGAATYRAFLLEDLLEIDLAFTPATEFGQLGDGAFRVVFGNAAPARSGSGIDRDLLVGMAWHHVLHARISIERAKPWQAEYWISALRDHLVTLACARLGLPTAYAKGADRLPAGILRPLEDTLVRGLQPGELSRALDAVTRALLHELHETDPELATRLTQSLLELAAVR